MSTCISLDPTRIQTLAQAIARAVSCCEGAATEPAGCNEGAAPQPAGCCDTAASVSAASQSAGCCEGTARAAPMIVVCACGSPS